MRTPPLCSASTFSKEPAGSEEAALFFLEMLKDTDYHAVVNAQCALGITCLQEITGCSFGADKEQCLKWWQTEGQYSTELK